MLYHHRHHHHHHLTSRKARVELLHLLHQNVPQKMTPWQARWKTKESQTGPYSTHKKMIKRQHENVECVCEKISRKKLDFSVLRVVLLCIQKAATRNITRWNITEGIF